MGGGLFLQALRILYLRILLFIYVLRHVCGGVFIYVLRHVVGVFLYLLMVCLGDLSLSDFYRCFFGQL